MRIHELSKDGDVDGIAAELMAGTPVDTREPESDRTPLMEALESSRAEWSVCVF